jgi:hypothetical protein
MTWLDRWSRRELGREGAERVSAGCYGSIVAASTLAGSAAIPPGELALLVVATNLVYFSTHVFAYSIGDPNVEGKHLHDAARELERSQDFGVRAKPQAAHCRGALASHSARPGQAAGPH